MSDALEVASDPESKTWRTLVLFYDHAEALARADAYHIETYSRPSRRARLAGPTHTKEPSV